MSTFETLIFILALVYVVANLYFAISGRILLKERQELEDQRADAMGDYENQIRVLTTRIGEVSTENTRLNNVVREWMETASTLKYENNKLKASEEEWMKQSEDYKSKYFEVQEELKKFTTAEGIK